MEQEKYIAISPKKKVFYYTEVGIINLKRLHRDTGVVGWQYGLESEKEKLLSKIITPKDAIELQKENDALKYKIQDLEANSNISKTEEHPKSEKKYK